MAKDYTQQLTGLLSGFKNGTKTAKDVTAVIKLVRVNNPSLADDWNKKLLEAIQAKK